MGRESREARTRRLLEDMPRPMLFALARGLDADVDANTYKDDLVDVLVAVSVSDLRRGLAEAVNATDLRTVCNRLGYTNTGSQAKMATRLVEALEAPGARITRWRPFVEARTFARSLKLASQSAWWAFVHGERATQERLPEDVPMTPYEVYGKSGWTSWGDFLGTDNPARHLIEYRPFKRARAYVRALGLANASEWKAFCAKRIGNRRVLPPDIPSAPYSVYAEHGWVSFGDWLGNDRVHASKLEYRTFEKARAFVRSIGIQTETEWRAYCRGEIHRSTPRPIDVPSNPNRSYRDHGWVTWGYFLGTNSVALYNRTYRSFASARAYVREQGLVDSKVWRVWCAAGNRPHDIPAAPDQVYAGKGWVSWGDFFGSQNVHPARMKRRPLREAAAFVRGLGIRNRTEFVRAWRDGRIPKDIPLTIDRMPGWKDWSSFLGT